MPAIQPADTTADLAVREPRQQRTREQWARVLDAGVELLEESGYDGFTIAALCERAGVPPRALYARTDTKDGLFLAVYEHGMSRVLADHEVFADADQWRTRQPTTRRAGGATPRQSLHRPRGVSAGSRAHLERPP